MNSTERVAAILRIQGSTYPEIAALLRITENEARRAVLRAVQEATMPDPNPDPNHPEFWLEVLRKWKQDYDKRNSYVQGAKNSGVSVTDIARILDVSRDTVYRWLEEVPEPVPCPGYPLHVHNPAPEPAGATVARILKKEGQTE